MSEHRRIFLGWDAPVVDKVRDYLLKSLHTNEGQPLDLENLLIVVPTRQAGRRLRETLAKWCDENKTSLLSARVVTPHYFFSRDVPAADAALPVLTQAVWVRVLMQADLSALRSLFPGTREERTFQWALNTSEIIEDLRQDLADGAFTIKRLLQDHAKDLEEPDRWRDLAKLEELFLAELEKTGKQDSCLAKISMAKSPKLDAPITKVVIAAVPDPSLLAIEALKALADRYQVDILIHAEQKMEDAFDAWGRPIPGKWRNFKIHMPGWTEDIFLESTPADQAQRVREEICRLSDRFESGEIAIGVPDRSVIPFLEKTMGAENLPPFDPADAVAAAHPVGLLAVCITNLLQARTYESVADLLRHPDFVRFLKNDHDLEGLKVLGQLDKFQNYYLPITLDSMLSPFKNNPGGTNEPRDDFTDLGKALKIVDSALKLFEHGGFEDAWRSLYRQVYGARNLEPASLRDAEFENAAMAVDSALGEFSELADAKMGFNTVATLRSSSLRSTSQLSSLFVSRLGRKTYHRERRDEVIDLEGWLELPWNDRPFLLVTGMNEEFVPGGSLSDAFLPDSLRKTLDLRDDSARFARDVFLMQGMINSRGKDGRACFIAGKTSISNEPLKPSRILFRCDDAELPQRVKKLLARIRNTRPRPYADVVFQLEPAGAEKVKDIRVDRRISVTSFRDYLECPFRFYLKHVLGMEELDDDKTGLDSMDFGTIVHGVLKTMGLDKKLWAASDTAGLANKLADLAEQQVTARFGSPHPPFIEISLLSAQERLRAVARKQKELVEQGWIIKHVETGEEKEGKEKERWQFKREDFVISGRIDRIDENTQDGRIRIIDYKTFDSFRTPESDHLASRDDNTPEYNDLVVVRQLKKGPKEEHKRWLDLQLPLYAMIYARGTELPDKLGLAYFGLPKATSETGISEWAKFDHEKMASAVRCLDGVLKHMKQGVFWPPADRTRHEDPFASLFRFEPERAFKRKADIVKTEDLLNRRQQR